jgi:hypothetical protein
MVTATTFIFALKVIPVRINTGSISQPILAALPIIPVSLLVNRITEHNLSYLSVTVATSIIIYASIMTTVFKNEQANQIVHSVVRKVKKQ